MPWPPDVADALTRATVGPAVEALLLASANVDGTVRLWDPATGQPPGQPLNGQNGRVESVAFGALARPSSAQADKVA